MNLLPQEKQKELRYEQLFHSVSVAAALAVGILMLGIVSQLVVWTYFTRTQGTTIRAIEELKRATDKTENAELKKQIKLVNSQILDFTSLMDRTPQWSKVLDAFSSRVPSGVKISKFTADLKTLQIDIAGYSPSREQVIELYNNINSDKEHFKDIDYPLENVAKPNDVQFRFTFFVQPEVLTAANP